MIEGRVDSGIRHNQFESGVYGELEQHLGSGTTLNGGLRVQYYQDGIAPLIGSIGVVRKIFSIEGMSVRGSITKNYRRPTINDLYWPLLGNPALEPEDGYSYELGLTYKRDKLELVASVYKNALSNLIVWLPGTDGQFRPQNVSESKSQGVEGNLGYAYSTRGKLRIDFVLSENRARAEAKDEWSRNVYQPNQQFGFTWSDYKKRIDWSCQYTYTGPVHTDYVAQEQSHDIDEIHLINLSLGYAASIIPRMRLGFSLRNLLNTNYEYVKDRPNPGRTLQFQINIYFNEKIKSI